MIDTLPHNKSAEKALISTLTTNPSYFRYVEHLTPEYFLDQKAKEAFSQIPFIKDSDRDWLEGDNFVSEWFTMGKMVFTSLEFEEVVKRVENAHTCRLGIIQGQEIAKAAYELDADQVEALIGGIELPNRGSEGRGMNEIVDELIGYYDNPGGDVVKTGFRKLDYQGILRRKETIGVAARPSMGKSQLIAQFGANIARRGGVVLHWSGEMSDRSVISRMVGADTGVSPRHIQTPEQKKRLIDAANKYRSMENLIILDDIRMTSMDVWAKARKIKQEFGRLDLVVVDHIRLLSDKNGEERHRLGAITKNLMHAAIELDCCMIVAIQLNRAVENQKDKRPGLADLRDSGEIEENLDVVSFLYREAYYTAREQKESRGGAQGGLAEFYAMKNRNGEMWGGKALYFDDVAPRFLESETREVSGG